MIATKRLSIQDKPGYIFMVNINNIDPDLLLTDEFTILKDESVVFEISYCQEHNTPHIVLMT